MSRAVSSLWSCFMAPLTLENGSVAWHWISSKQHAMSFLYSSLAELPDYHRLTTSPRYKAIPVHKQAIMFSRLISLTETLARYLSNSASNSLRTPICPYSIADNLMCLITSRCNREKSTTQHVAHCSWHDHDSTNGAYTGTAPIVHL